MRECPVCHTENPSKATHCMKCGTLLVELENLPVEELLRLKLVDAEKKINALETALGNQIILYEDAQKRIVQLESHANAQMEIGETCKNEGELYEVNKLKAQIASLQRLVDSQSALIESYRNESVSETIQYSVDSNILRYEASNRLDVDWIVKKSLLHTFANGKGEVMLIASVNEIDDEAFAYCSGLTSIAIPNSVCRIGKFAFYGCSGLMSVSIGNSIAYIGDLAFSSCRNLIDVKLPDSVMEISDTAFNGCGNLSEETKKRILKINSNALNSICYENMSRMSYRESA